MLITCSLSHPAYLGSSSLFSTCNQTPPYLILIYLLSVLLTALFSHSWLRPEPSLLKSGHLCNGDLRAFCPHLSSLPLSWSVADAQQRWHGGLCLCSVHAANHHLDKQLITLASWASWDVNPGGQELHLMIAVGFSYGGWTSELCLRNIFSGYSWIQRGLWLQALVLRRSADIAVPEKVIGIDVPLLTSTCFCYLDLCCSGHRETFTWQTAVTMEDLVLLLWLVAALLREAAAPFMCGQKRLCPSPLQARSTEWFKVLMSVVSANSSSFVQSVRECPQNFFCGPSCGVVLPDGRCWWTTVKQNIFSQLSQKDVCHWPWEMGQLIWQKSSSC